MLGRTESLHRGPMGTLRTQRHPGRGIAHREGSEGNLRFRKVNFSFYRNMARESFWRSSRFRLAHGMVLVRVVAVLRNRDKCECVFLRLRRTARFCAIEAHEQNAILAIRLWLGNGFRVTGLRDVQYRGTSRFTVQFSHFLSFSCSFFITRIGCSA